MLATVSHNRNIILFICFNAATPNPMVTVSGPTTVSNSITVSAGTKLELTCSVSVVEHLVSSPMVEWRRGSSGNAIVENTQKLVLPLTFHSLQISDGDLYSCVASINIESVNVERTNSEVIIITVQSK